MTTATIPAPATAPSGRNLQFRENSLEPDDNEGPFFVVNKRFLRIDVDGETWIRRGSVIAHRGDLVFRRERVIQGDLRGLCREFAPLARVTGRGRMFCAAEGKRAVVLQVMGAPVEVISTALLAFEVSLTHHAHLVKHVGLVAGGLYCIQLDGFGLFGLSPKGDPLTLRVTPDQPVITDPDATVAWTSGVTPHLKTGFDWRSLIGHGGGEAIEMELTGDGYVVVQAKEEDASKRPLMRRARSLVKKFVPI